MAEHVKQFARLSYQTLGRLFPSRNFRVFGMILFSAFVLMGTLSFISPASALVDWAIDGFINTVVWMMLQLSALFIQVTVFFLRLFILIAGYNDYIDAPVVTLGWNMVRDLANMFFIVILMVIAFGTILGLEQYEWRRSLVKLILAAILVNFSNLIIQLMIDVVQVFVVTFLNAVAGAAGGNLIQMFNFDKIYDIVVGNNPNGSKLTLQLFGAGVMSITFAAIAMMTLFAYVAILLGRMVTLWVAIILSPLMFLFGVLPQTKKYADEYWNQVVNNLLSAPIMVFFLWLAFATFGGGNGVVAHIEDDHALKEAGKITNKTTSDGSPASASFNEAASWGNMANFAVAIAFLWLGIDRVQKLGVAGGSMLSGAANFGKKVVTIASGYAAGRWLYENAGVPGVKSVAYNMPLGGRFWKNVGTYAKGRAGAAYGRYTENKNEKYAQWEKDKIKEGKTSRVYARRAWGAAMGGLGGFVGGQSAARFEKIATDWKDTAERQKEIVEETYATGSTTLAGRTKTRTTARKKMMEEMLEQKKAKKVEEAIQDIITDVKQGTATPQEESAVEKLETAGKERQARREIRREKELFDAEQEAKILRSQGRELEAQAVVNAVHQRHLKEKREVFDSVDHTTRIAAAKSMAERIAKQRNIIATTNDAGERQKAENIYAQLRGDMMQLLTVAAEDSEEQYQDVLEAALSKIYAGQDIQFTRESEGKLLLEGISGGKIDTAADFNNAHKSLEGNRTFSGTEQSQMAMAALSSALKKQAGQGGLRGASAVVADNKDTANQFGTESSKFSDVAYRFAMDKNLPGADPARADRDIEKKKGTEEWFQQRVNLRNARNLHGFMAVKKRSSDGKTLITGISDEQATQLVKRLSTFSDVREAAGGFSDTIGEYNLKDNFDTQQAKRDLVDKVLKKLKDSYNQSVDRKKIFNNIMENQFSDFITDVGLYNVSNQQTAGTPTP